MRTVLHLIRHWIRLHIVWPFMHWWTRAPLYHPTAGAEIQAQLDTCPPWTIIEPVGTITLRDPIRVPDKIVMIRNGTFKTYGVGSQ